ncbi:hypothetical protein BH10PSE12_BH10PSE12_02670 [soil metagenome]
MITAILDGIAYVAALIGGAIVLSAFGLGQSAPQQGAAAAVGIGVAAIPYFIAAINHRQELLKAVKRQRT